MRVGWLGIGFSCGLLFGLATKVGAEGAGLSAADFEALTQGRTLILHLAQNETLLQTFLPERRVVWRDEAGCHTGSWTEEGGLLCFRKHGVAGDGKEFPNQCWEFAPSEDGFLGWYQGDRQFPPLRLTFRRTTLLTCSDGVL